MADQHLHPRNLATALILLAVSRIMAGQRLQAVPLLMLSFVLHPIMAALGISFCFFLTIALLDPVHVWLRSLRSSLAAAVPLGWIFESPTPIWRQALQTRRYLLSLSTGPGMSGWARWRLCSSSGCCGALPKSAAKPILARFALAVFAYGVFQQAVAMIMLGSPSLVRLTPLQPMRFLQLIYCFMALLGGCLLGKFLLKASVWRWAVFLLVINAGMFAAQRALFPSSEHLELPGMRPSNPWLQAFAWIRINTPADAYFALDPRYLEAPGEDSHSFRALAERSQLADAIKDTAMVTQVPELGPTWEHQVAAQAGWDNFQLADFERLKTEFGVNWVLVNYPQPAGLPCSWHNDTLSVCRVP